MRKIVMSIGVASLLFSLSALNACKKGEAPAASNSAQKGTAELQGTVKIDGSSTVFPISEAMAEEFQAVPNR